MITRAVQKNKLILKMEDQKDKTFRHPITKQHSERSMPQTTTTKSYAALNSR